ncbi:MAG TPA: hypothetical protein PK812_07130 [Beijerinckiaceae bacterium]|nr:hypothetical protein [Beijerinckiaceae bacterium]
MLARLARPTIALALALGLGGCFQPLHGGALSGSADVLAQIEVMPITGHLGHQVKSELDFVLNNGRPPENPQYRLTVRTNPSVGSVVADSVGGRPQVMTLVVSANYQLVAIKDGRSISFGTATSNASFDRTQQRFATTRATVDAEIRSAKVLAEQIKARIIPDLFAPKS